MDEDISRRAVLALVIMAVVVSMLSTSLVLNAVYSRDYFNKPAPAPEKQVVLEPSARVSLFVPAQPVFSTGSAVASLEVVSP